MKKSTGKIDDEEDKKQKRHQPPGRTPDARERQIIVKAYDLVEKRIERGTATSQEVTHFLKMGSSIAQLEKAKLEHENQLLQAKTEQLQSQKRIEELYADALAAMKVYKGETDSTDDD